MIRRITRISAPLTLVAPATLLWLSGGCGGSDVTIAIAKEAGAPPAFVEPEAGVGAVADLASYCPTNKCPPGWTTCPNSRFPCDVNLATDMNNCGACGLACPAAAGNVIGAEVFSCVDGACVMSCRSNWGRLDCDGIVDNGCETYTDQHSHCGACGKTCSDPAKECADQTGRAYKRVFDCGCPPDKILCDHGCWDKASDDAYCGDCSTHCDPTGGGLPPIPNAYYGCFDSHCGEVKCMPNFGNCDGQAANGCESSLDTDENCGGCGKVCPAGQSCRLNPFMVPECMCPEGKAYCKTSCFGPFCLGRCFDILSDPYNCGACGHSCHRSNNATSVCNHGSCDMLCNDGRADCNNSQADGCEVNTDSDPRNCGACGHVCDAVTGQACVAGRCVIEPCDGGVGAGAR